jgi:hypothetical protein
LLHCTSLLFCRPVSCRLTSSNVPQLGSVEIRVNTKRGAAACVHHHLAQFDAFSSRSYSLSSGAWVSYQQPTRESLFILARPGYSNTCRGCAILFAERSSTAPNIGSGWRTHRLRPGAMDPEGNTLRASQSLTYMLEVPRSSSLRTAEEE